MSEKPMVEVTSLSTTLTGENPALDPAELYNMKVLQGVSIPSVEPLLASCLVRALAAGEILLEAGQPNRVMYMILAGRLSVHLESPASDPVAFLETGETVGELSVLDESPASAFVLAAAPTRLLVIDEKSFWQLINASHDFTTNLLMLLVSRLRKNNSTVTHNIRLQQEYKQNAMVDGLTGIYNRRWFEEALPRFINRHQRSGRPLVLLVIDVDHFKKFNDTFGHPAGDHVLRVVAQTLKLSVRPSDMPARFGGEEFVVILPETDDAGARSVAERLRAAVAKTDLVTPQGESLPHVTISIGGARLQPGQDMSALLAIADAALYESKRAGRNRVTFGTFS